MNKDNLLQEIEEIFIQNFIDEGYTEPEAIKSWEVLNNTYKEYLANFTLPGAKGNSTDREILDYFKSSGELIKIRETAVNRIDRII